MNNKQTDVTREILDVLERAHRVKSGYNEIFPRQSAKRDANAIVQIIGQQVGIDIFLQQRKTLSNKLFRGSINRFLNTATQAYSAKICIAPIKSDTNPHGITTCEQRFVGVKDSSHLLEDEIFFVKDIVKMLSELRFIWPASPLREVALENLPIYVRSEIYARLFASEVLYPFEERNCKENQDLSTLDIAKKYMIPVREVEWLMREHDNIAMYHRKLQERYENEYKPKEMLA